MFTKENNRRREAVSGFGLLLKSDPSDLYLSKWLRSVTKVPNCRYFSRKNFGVLDWWLLMGGSNTWRLDCILFLLLRVSRDASQLDYE